MGRENLAKTREDVEFLGLTVEQHTQKAVQMHNLARNFAARLNKEVVTSDKAAKFGLDGP